MSTCNTAPFGDLYVQFEALCILAAHSLIGRDMYDEDCAKLQERVEDRQFSNDDGDIDPSFDD